MCDVIGGAASAADPKMHDPPGFGVHFVIILGHFWQQFSYRFSRYVFNHFFLDLDVHFGSNLASKTTPGGTPTRKGGPSILNNPPCVFNGFGPVAVAEGSRRRPLKRKTFYNEIRSPKCLQNDSEMDSKTVQNGIKKRCRNCFKKLCEIIPKNTPKWYPK